jgi:flagellar motor switch protein FliM
MHRERLSAEEMEVLLRSGETETIPPESAVETGSHDETCSHTADALLSLHQRFAGDLTELLQDLTGSEARVRLRDAARGAYGQFVCGQTVPTCCAVIQAEPIKAEFLFAISPSILFPVLDHMLGCDQPEPPQQRPLTEIEAALATLLVEQVLARYQDAWQGVLALDLTVDRIEHNAQQMRAMPGSEPTFLVRYDVRCGRAQGWADVCIPWHSTQRMRERLAANRA